jgi:hypothetical protein
MLASLLPGLRELRAPLAAGYLWLVTLWIAVAPKIQEMISAEGAYRDIYSLGQAVGKPAIAIASAFAAYLIGTLSIGVTTFLTNRFSSLNDFSRVAKKPIHQAVLRRIDEVLKSSNTAWEDIHEILVRAREFIKTDDPRTFQVIETLTVRSSNFDAFSYRSDGGKEISFAYTNVPDLANFARDARVGVHLIALQTLENFETLKSNTFIRHELARTMVDLERYVDDCITDLPSLAARLVGKEPDVYGAYDRLRAESEFRLGVAVPLAILFIALAYRSTPLWVLGILPCIALAELGRRSSMQAFGQLAESLNAKRLDSPVLEGIGKEPLIMHSVEAYSREVEDACHKFFGQVEEIVQSHQEDLSSRQSSTGETDTTPLDKSRRP